MPSPDRCPRCDRAECPWHLLPDPDSDDDRALFSADRARADANCRAHELTIEQWRAEALALRARLADPPSLAPLRARAEALLAVIDKATPGPWTTDAGPPPPDSNERVIERVEWSKLRQRGESIISSLDAWAPYRVVRTDAREVIRVLMDKVEAMRTIRCLQDGAMAAWRGQCEASAEAIAALRDAPALIRDLLAALATPKSETARSPEPFLDAARCGTSSVAEGKVPPSADIGNLVDEFGAAAERLGCDPCNADRARAKAVARKALLAALGDNLPTKET